MNLRNSNWLIMYMQSCINPPPILLNKLVPCIHKECDIIRINNYWGPASDMSKTYELEIAMFEHVKIEYFLKMVKNFTATIFGTGTTNAT